MGSIFFQRCVSRWVAQIHDVVVDEAYRGKGLGGRLVRELLRQAMSFSDINGEEQVEVSLTSRPSRVAANALYQKLGFVLVSAATGEHGTNLYKIIAEPTGLRGLR
jgi:ribosomal protein S18 acetylase RimI-like enzyme